MYIRQRNKIKNVIKNLEVLLPALNISTAHDWKVYLQVLSCFAVHMTYHTAFSVKALI